MNIKQIALSAVVSATMLTTGSFAQGKSENKMLHSSMQDRIINGTEVSDSDDSWRSIVALKTGSHQFCAGTLIAENWVLTAAHCVKDYSPSDFTIGANSYKPSTTTAYNVEEIIVHPNHEGFIFENDTGSNNDIALIKLSTPVTTVTPISYRTNPNEIAEGTNTKTAGWGRMHSATGLPAVSLMEISLPIISRDNCNASSSYDGVISENMICAGYMEGGTGPCYGDSGGPLVIDNELAGIVSWGSGCAEENRPAVYTNVKQYTSWISEHVGDQPNDSTVWAKSPYENNEDETRELCIDGADTLTVKAGGELEEGYDFLTISDISGNELEKLTGNFNDTEFLVDSNCIIAHFTSDYSVTKLGFLLSVEDGGNVGPIEPDNEWINRPYENNEDETKQLCVDGAEAIIVTITGNIEEGYDFLTIDNYLGNQLNNLTGALDETIGVAGSCISAHFTSDPIITTEGFTITVEDADNVGPIEPDNEWINRPYENNEDETKELCVLGAEALKVTITGDIEEGYDFLTIDNYLGNQLKNLTGALDETIGVAGSCISAHFTSDPIITTEGFTITVEGALLDP